MMAAIRSHALPFLSQLAPAGRGERIEPRLPVAVGRAPVAAHESALFQAHQRGIERPILS